MQKQEQKKITKPFLNVVETSEYLGLKRSTIYSYTSKKGIPFYKIRRVILFKVTELDEFIEKHRIKSSAEIEQEALRHFISEKV
ncbi:MAG: helix-turn-helix domain-containing protein [Candidatus Tenebribacter burtonii]|jgi:excisionase family DNA binding protein|nr:helix-turn-helix domain-containing protein [Candidatus Tenebribacter burtonii]